MGPEKEEKRELLFQVEVVSLAWTTLQKQNKNQRVQLATLLPQRPTFSFISIHYAIFGLPSPRKSVGYQRVLFKIMFSLLQNILFAFP